MAIVRITHIGICGTDLHAFEGTQPYFSYPRILGHELSGELVQADGNNAIAPGERVTLLPYFNCGKCIACRSGRPNCCAHLSVCGVHADGGMTEYLAVPSHLLVASQGLGPAELALVESLAIGAHGVRRAGIAKNEFVLVMGAGPIGAGTMAFARIAGATVIAIDTNRSRLQFCSRRQLAHYTIHAGDVDILQQLQHITLGDMPTVVIDATGNQQAINNGLQYLAHSGRYVLIGLQKNELIFSHPEFHKRETTLMTSRNATREDFDHVIASIRKGDINAGDFITEQVPFSQVKDLFPGWLTPSDTRIKTIVQMD